MTPRSSENDTLPSTPGNLGTLDAGAMLGLMTLGIGGEEAVSFALLYRLVQWGPSTAAAAVVWAFRSRRGAATRQTNAGPSCTSPAVVKPAA